MSLPGLADDADVSDIAAGFAPSIGDIRDKLNALITSLTAGVAAATQTFATADGTHAARTAVVLVDNSAGVANTTIEAMANPTDAPATADALRDDIVAVLLPAIRNNIADLAAAHNALVVDLADTATFLNHVVDKLQLAALLT